MNIIHSSSTTKLLPTTVEFLNNNLDCSLIIDPVTYIKNNTKFNFEKSDPAIIGFDTTEIDNLLALINQMNSKSIVINIENYFGLLLPIETGLKYIKSNDYNNYGGCFDIIDTSQNKYIILDENDRVYIKF